MKKSELEKEVTRLTGLLKNAENNANYWLSQHEDRRKELDTLIAENTKLKEQLEAVRKAVMEPSVVPPREIEAGDVVALTRQYLGLPKGTRCFVIHKDIFQAGPIYWVRVMTGLRGTLLLHGSDIELAETKRNAQTVNKENQ